MEHVIISGGAGFIGSHLTKRLLNMEYRVTVIDNFSTGHKDKLKEVIDHPHLKLLNHNITKPIDLECDYLFNLASRASPKDFLKYPHDILMTNSIGTKNMIEIALSSGARFLQGSTSEVYGDPKISPQDENYHGNVSSTGIRSCYDEGKRFAEALLFSYYRSFDMDIRIIRIFNTYGPFMNIDDGRVIPNFIKQALYKNKFTIYGKGNQTRSFCYVDDLIDGMLKFMFSDDKNLKGEVINLGNPEPITINELAIEINELIGNKMEFDFVQLPEDDPVNRCPDITKAKNLLGWSPKISRKDGLNRTIDYFKAILNLNQ